LAQVYRSRPGWGRLSAMVQTEEPLSSPTGRERALVPAILVVITFVGAVVRATGISAGGLFYDDAWFALPARVSFSTAIKMVVTTPGYTVLQSAWISLGPAGNTWPKLLPFVLGVAVIPATYWLCRRMDLPRWASLVGTGLIAAAPAAIEYSVRVKEYEVDLLLAIAVLVVGEVARRRRTTASLVCLAAVGIGAVLVSSALLVVVAGSWLALLLVCLGDRRRRGAVVLGAGVTAVACAVQAAWISTHIPASLTKFWIDTDRLIGKPFSWPHLSHTLALTPGGLAHGFLGTPLPTGPFPLVRQITHSAEAALLMLGVVEVALLVVLGLPAISAALRRRGDAPALAFLAPTLTLVLAVGLWAVGLVPLGTGRTDLVLYPAIVLLVASGIVRLATWLSTAGSFGAATRRTAAIGLAVVAGIAGVGLSWHQRSWYPAQDLDGLRSAMGPQLRPGDVEVVAGRNSFTWAFQGDSPFVVHVDRNDARGRTVGFWVTFTPPRVLEVLPTRPSLLPQGAVAIPGLDAVPASAHRLWVFATTNATLSPSSYHLSGQVARAMTPIGIDPVLRKAGWFQQRKRFHAPGVVAVLYTR